MKQLFRRASLWLAGISMAVGVVAALYEAPSLGLAAFLALDLFICIHAATDEATP